MMVECVFRAFQAFVDLSVVKRDKLLQFFAGGRIDRHDWHCNLINAGWRSVILSEVEGSRGVTLKLSLRDSSTPLGMTVWFCAATTSALWESKRGRADRRAIAPRVREAPPGLRLARSSHDHSGSARSRSVRPSRRLRSGQQA